MKRILALLIVVVASFAGCSRETPTLHIYTWADYVKPELVTAFEKANSCRVVIDTFDSNEAMYAKLKAGATGYDLVFPSSYMARVMWRQGMLQRLDRTQLPNLANVPNQISPFLSSSSEMVPAPYAPSPGNVSRSYRVIRPVPGSK